MNKVLQQAYMDFNPSTVDINEDIMQSMYFSDDERNTLVNSIHPYFHEKDLFDSICFMLTFNSINYQFWSIENNEFNRYTHNGSIGALAAFNGFIKLYEELQQLNFDKNKINHNLLIKHLGQIPSIDSRIDILKESFDLDKLSIIYKLIDESILNKNIVNTDLAFIISKILPKSYHDPYLKKIQLSLYEIGKLYENKIADINNIQYDITVAADYQIPKVLFSLNILKYNNDLTYKINNYSPISFNSLEEKAIRAATIIACEKISQIHNIDIPTLDKLLWLYRNDFGNIPFHLTFTTNY